MNKTNYLVAAAVGAVVMTGAALTQRQTESVGIERLALVHEGRVVLAAQTEATDEPNDPSYSGPNNQYNANQSYDASGPYNANAAYNAHNAYSANNSYSANDSYNAHNQYSAHDQYSANDQYNANRQYNRTASGSGVDDAAVEARNTRSNYTFPWLMGDEGNRPLPKPLVVVEN